MRPRQLLAISAYWLAVNLHWGALLVVIMPRQVELIWPARQAQLLGVIFGVGALVALVTPPIVGAYSDRSLSPWGRRRPYMTAGVAINLLGLLMMWAAGDRLSFWLFLLAYLVVQLGNNVSTGSYTGVIPDLVPEGQVGDASGYMAAITQLGTVLGGFSSGYLMGHGYVSASYLIIGVTLLLALGVTLVGVRERPLAQAPAAITWIGVLKSLWIDPRRHPDFAWVWVTRALVTMGMWTVQPFIQPYLRDVVHVKDYVQQSGVLLGTILIGATAAGLVGGRLSDRIGRKRVVYVANGVIAAASLVFLLSHSLSFTFAVGVIYGLGFGAYYSVDWALGCDVLPAKADAAKDLGVWHIAMVLPQSVAPFIAGGVLQRFALTGHTALAGQAAYSLAGYSVILSCRLLPGAGRGAAEECARGAIGRPTG